MSRLRQLEQLVRSLKPAGFEGAVSVGWLMSLMVCTGVWTELVDPSYAEWQLRQWAGPAIIIGSFVLTSIASGLYLMARWTQLREGILADAEGMLFVELDEP